MKRMQKESQPKRANVMHKNYYQHLGISEDATLKEVKRAYRKLARTYHPDVNKSKDASKRMAELNEAYHVLSDEKRRIEYDARRSNGTPATQEVIVEAGAIRAVHHLTIVGISSPPYTSCFHNDDRELAVASFDNVLRFFDPLSGEQNCEVSLNGGYVSRLRSLGEGKIFAGGVSERACSLWEIQNYKAVRSISKRVEWASHIAIHPEAKNFAVGGVNRVVQVFDLPSGRKRFSRECHDKPVSALAYNSSGNLIASGSTDCKVVFLETKKGEEFGRLRRLGTAPVEIVFSDDDSIIAVAVVDRLIRVYSMKNGQQISSLWGHDSPIESMAFHPKGWLLASGCRLGEIRLWNVLGSKLLSILGGHSGPIKSLAFSKDGSQLCAAGFDKTASIWNIHVGEEHKEENKE